jgi:hypothetical protein
VQQSKHVKQLTNVSKVITAALANDYTTIVLPIMETETMINLMEAQIRRTTNPSLLF